MNASRSWPFGKGGSKGIYLGYYYKDENQHIGDPIIYEDDRHLLMFGPTSTGKTRRFLLVNLLSDNLNDRSVIVVDPKGELAAVTALYRHKLGHQVKVLDPFGKLREIVALNPARYKELEKSGLIESAGFNPMRSLDATSPYFFDNASLIAEALIKISEHEPHWTESAQGLLTAFLMWEKQQKGDNAFLHNVRTMLTEAEDVKKTEKGADIVFSGFRHTIGKMVDGGGEIIASLAGRFGTENEEMFSVRSSADTQTRWIFSPQMAADLKKPGVEFGKLKGERTTVYLILPAERLRTHGVWLRLVIVSALQALYKAGGIRTVLFIDEMAALGRLGPLEDAFGLVRGYRVQIVGILQDLNQLKALYKDRHESFLANAGVVEAFAPNDLVTADWLSRRSGQTTLFTKSINSSAGPDGSSQENINRQPIARTVWMPHELMGLARGTGLFWLAGMEEGVRFAAPDYEDIALCKSRASHNPYGMGT